MLGGTNALIKTDLMFFRKINVNHKVKTRNKKGGKV